MLRRIRSPHLRRLLVVTACGAALVVGLVAAGAAYMALAWSRATTDTVGTLDFANPLHVPQLLEPSLDPDGTSVFELDLRAARSEILPGRSTPTWGINGDHLGPTLRARRGDRIRIEVSNSLPETTTLHWHGMHLPAAADGGPHQEIEPGGRWAPRWRIDQPAASLWYHPHVHGRTADHVYRGLAGMFIIDDDEPVGEMLPHDYGIDDFPLIVQDKRFDDDGAFDHSEPLFSSLGILGDQLLVNGTHDPHLEVSTDRVRLRLLNASNGRVFDFGFDDDRSFEHVATDGGLLPAVETTDRLQLSPGERAEIVVRVRPGERTVLRSYPPDLGVDGFQGRFSGGADTFDVLELRPADELAPRAAPPRQLVAHRGLGPADAAVTRSIELTSSTSINRRSMDMTRVDMVAEAGTTEVWDVVNRSGGIHNFHVHDVQFDVLSYDGGPPPPHLRGPKDTVFLPPGVGATLVMRFGSHTDPLTPYMFHCHILRHEDDGMMGQFTVVEPDTAEPAPRRLEIDHGNVAPGHVHTGHGD